MRCLAPTTRLLLAAVLALWLGVRLLTPAGFMPSFANGVLAIVQCPDGDGAPTPPATAMPDMPGMDMAAMPGMAAPEAHDAGHRAKAGLHQVCPYAQAASLAGLDTEFIALAVALLLASLPPPSRALPAFRRHATRERPPSQAPPLPA